SRTAVPLRRDEAPPFGKGCVSVGSVVAGVALHSARDLRGRLTIAAIDAWARCRETATAGPGTPVLDLLGSSDGDGYAAMGSRCHGVDDAQRLPNVGLRRPYE